MKNLKPLYLMLAVLLACTVGSCKKDKDDTTSTFVYTTSRSSTLISSFTLNNTNIKSVNVSKVFFTIDPERGMIYNADSLPKGTDISKLKVELKFRSAVRSAVFYVVEQDMSITDHEYKNNTSDSLDFRNVVTLTVTSADGLNEKDYMIQVNVHEQEPDTIVWPANARRNLPGATDENYAVSTTSYEDGYWSLIHNKNGFFLSSAETPAGPWDVKSVAWGFEPDAKSLTATEDALYVLDTEGDLYRSTDGNKWTATEERWSVILGAYGDRLLGITDEPYKYVEYPQRSNFTYKDIDERFPIKGMSQLIAIEPTWAVAPQVMMVGGVLADGTLSNTTWGYDGENWAPLSNTNISILPALEGPTLFAYYNYTTDNNTEKIVRRNVWMLMGGRNADGLLNYKTYLSYDMGITWDLADDAMFQPGYMHDFYGAQAFVCTMPVTNGKVPMRRIAQKPTTWDCPFIFIFGGYDEEGKLLNNIWCGAHNRFIQKPLY